MHYLIDTNVPLTANNASSAGPACVLAAIRRLLQLRQHEILVLDDAFQILNEYRRKLSPTGQPGPGDAFLLWAYQNRSNPRHCHQVTLLTAADGSFAVFPTDPALATFDPADRKFVAAALTHPAKPPIVNATDSDWHHAHDNLVRNGVSVEFICPDEMVAPRRTE